MYEGHISDAAGREQKLQHLLTIDTGSILLASLSLLLVRTLTKFRAQCVKMVDEISTGTSNAIMLSHYCGFRTFDAHMRR